MNWKVRLKNKAFWMAAIPGLLLILQPILSLCGVNVDLTAKQDMIMQAANAILGMLAMLGILADPTTEGLGDSMLAMTYEEPKENATTVVSLDEAIALAKERIVDLARSEKGYYGHASEADLDKAQANPGGKFTKYARDLDAIGYFNGKKQGFDWCCVFVAWLFVQVCGRVAAKQVLHQPSGSNMAAVVHYWRDYLGSEVAFTDIEVGDLAIYGPDQDHIGIVTEVGEDYFRCLSGNANSASPFPGGGVGEYKHPIGSIQIQYYIRPDWELVAR